MYICIYVYIYFHIHALVYLFSFEAIFNKYNMFMQIPHTPEPVATSPELQKSIPHGILSSQSGMRFGEWKAISIPDLPKSLRKLGAPLQGSIRVP